jgi:hypothetical protein
LWEQENSQRKFTQTLFPKKYCKSQAQKLPFSTPIHNAEQLFRVMKGVFLKTARGGRLSSACRSINGEDGRLLKSL